MKNHQDIFAHTDCIPEETLLKYISNTLSPAEKHEVEKHLIDCEMCSDAVEGLGMIADKKKNRAITSELNQKIQTRVEKKKEVKIFFLQQYRTQLAVAASILLVIGLVWFFRSNINEMDSASSEKIFADKFEPYPSEKKEEVASENNQTKTDNGDMPITAKEESPAGFSSEKNGKPRNENAIEVNNQILKTKNNIKSESFKEKEKKIETKESEIIALADNATPSEPSASNQPVENKSKALKKQDINKSAVGNAIIDADTRTGSTVTRKEFESMSSKDVNSFAAASADVSQQDKSNYSKVRDNRSNDLTSYKMGNKEKTKSAAPTSKSISEVVVTNYTIPALDSVAALTKADSTMIKYDKQDYPGAITDFEQMLKQNPDDEKALFYSAVSYLSLGQADNAITNLNKVLQNKNGEYYDAAQWYLSLAYIKKKDIQNARRNLMEIQNNSKSKYQKQAEDTLKEMNK